MTTFDYDLGAARHELAGLVDPIVTDDSHGLPEGAWGREVRINMSGCNYDVISDSRAVAEIIRQLVNEIGMRAYGEPMSFTFGQGALYGNTGIQVGTKSQYKTSTTNSQTHQLVETSNITVHANHAVRKRTVFANIFSCAEFDPESVVAFVTTAFGSKKHTFDNTLRIAPDWDEEDD